MELTMNELYHYTTIEAVNSIIRDNGITLWATRYDYLNDKSEFIHGVDTINKCLSEFEETEKINEVERISQYADTLGKEMKKLYSEKEIGFYTISLSEEGNSLPMWNTYSKNCNGIALCFNSNLIKECIENFSSIKPLPPYENLLKKIKYTHEDVLEIIKNQYHLLKSNSKQSSIGNYINLLNFLAICIKNKCFEYEKEWRIIIKDDDYTVEGNKNLTKGCTFQTQFRVKNGMLIPYKEISFPKEALTRIMVGPTHNFEQSQKSLKLFLSSKGIDVSKVEILKSVLPFRI